MALTPQIPLRGRLTTSLVEHEPVGPAGPRMDPSASDSAAGPSVSESHIEATRGGNGDGKWDDAVNKAALDQADRSDLHDQELELVGDEPEGLDERRRTIKRYSNRKLYDTRQSRY